MKRLWVLMLFGVALSSIPASHANQGKTISGLWVSCAPMVFGEMRVACERFIKSVLDSHTLLTDKSANICLPSPDRIGSSGKTQNRLLRETVYSYLEDEKDSNSGFLHLSTAADLVLLAFEKRFPC